ncbi:aminotransferase class III-fold pyridoxal phosphate-dependent enzyme [Polaromonas sp. P1(28)-13]|nr:aminotransferase class III-fold pyridoxal phosphate-dependent enzyme [Polaromonas sp. P1(28)-13]
MKPTPNGYGAHGGPVQLFFMKKDAPRRPMIERGDGIYLWDTQGRRYIDASSGPIAANLGHGNARVIAASDRQIRKVAYASRVFFENQANIELADIVTGLAGPGLERAFFVSGGSEANESAMKMARQYAITQGQASRWKVLSRNPSYHGSTLGTIAISGDPVSEAAFGPMTRLMPKVPAPFTYRLPEGVTAEANGALCADALEQTILREGPATVLAFILEPVGGLATGALVAPDGYYARVREICSRHGVLLIFDEVMSGAGRTGSFLAAHHWPQARARYRDPGQGPGRRLHAAGGGAGFVRHRRCPGRGRRLHARLHLWLQPPVLRDRPRRRRRDRGARADPQRRNHGRAAATAAAGTSKGSRVIGDIRGKGLLMAIEIVADRDSKAILPAEAMAIPRIVALGMERGLLLYSRRTANGRHGEWLMVAPPLIVDARQIDTIAGLIGETLGAFRAGTGCDGSAGVKFGVEIPFVHLLGFDLELFEKGQSRISYAPRPEHMNAFGVTHGGALMTLLDVAMAAAARSVQQDQGLVTIEMKTSFMQMARGRVTAKGRLLHRSASMAFTEASVLDEEGRHCAHATATFKYLHPDSISTGTPA